MVKVKKEILLNILRTLNIDKRNKNILFTSIATLIAKVINALVLFISIPLTLNYLGSERFGMMMSIVATIGILSFADLGLGFGLQNRIAYYEANNQTILLKKAVSSTFFFLLTFTIFILLVFSILFNTISWDLFFNVKDKIARIEANNSVLVFFLCFSVTIPFSIVQKIQDGYQQGFINQIWIACGNVFGLIILTIFIHIRMGVPFLIMAIYGSNTIFMILNFVYLFFYERKYLFPTFEYIDLDLLKKLIKEGIKYFTLQSSAVINNSSDNLIIAKSISPILVTTYSVGQRLVYFLTLPTQIIIPSMLPALNDAFARKDYKWAKCNIKKNLKFLLILSLLGGIIMYWGNNTIIRLWLKKENLFSFELIIGLIALVFFYNFIAYFSILSLTQKYLNISLRVFPIASLLSIIAKIIFVHFFSIIGVIIAQIIILSAIFMFPLYSYIKKELLKG